MIKNLSENITDYFYSNKIINENEREIYIYGLQLIISSITGIVVILTLGSIFDIITNTGLFLIAFIPIRMYSGGYHANTYIECNLALISIYSVTMMIVYCTPVKLINLSSLLFFFITSFIILKYAPVDDVRKRLSSEIKKVNKKITFNIYSQSVKK